MPDRVSYNSYFSRTKKALLFLSGATIIILTQSLDHAHAFVHTSYTATTGTTSATSATPTSTLNLKYITHRYNNMERVKDTTIIPSFTTTTTMHNNRLTRLYATFESNNEFPNSEDDDDNNNEEEEEEDDNEYMDYDSDIVETARKRLEDMVSIPQDNMDSSSSSTSSTTSSSTSSSSSSSPPSSSPSMPRFGPRKPILFNNKEKEQNEKIQQTSSSSSSSQILTHKLQNLINKITPPPLTTILRERKLTELTLLQSLDKSDDAVNELWALWFAERGPQAATLLLRAEELVSMGESKWSDAEELLWSLVEEHGVHWAEPVNRLATLYYLQGRMEESKELCEVVLQSKPWHFGALSGIVLVCAGMNDVSGARLWADRRLPPLLPQHTSGDRRAVWVRRACVDATNCLERAEKRSNIGMEEMEFRKMRNWLQHVEEEEGEEEENYYHGEEEEEEEEDSWQ